MPPRSRIGPAATSLTSPASTSDFDITARRAGRQERAVLVAERGAIDGAGADLRQQVERHVAARAGRSTTGASATGISFASTARSIVSSTPPAQSALAITATADRDAGMNALRAPKPLTAPPCCSTSTGPRSRIDWPQP